jgi:hypothetical protein
MDELFDDERLNNELEAALLRLDLRGLAPLEALAELDELLQEGREGERAAVSLGAPEDQARLFLPIVRRLMEVRKERRLRRCFSWPRVGQAERFLLLFGPRPYLRDPDAPPSLTVDESMSLYGAGEPWSRDE